MLTLVTWLSAVFPIFPLQSCLFPIVIDMFHDEGYFEVMQISYSLPYFSPLILASVKDPCLKQRLLRSLQNGKFCISIFASFHHAVPSPTFMFPIIYLYDYGLIDIYFII